MNQLEFRPILKIYFEDQVIVRDLLQSGIAFEKKCEYFKHVHVFEDAYKSRHFNKINYWVNMWDALKITYLISKFSS
jgi:hypothetical protein